MKKRIYLLQTLVGLNRPISEIKKDVLSLPWDYNSKEDAIILTKNNLINVMNLFINNKITSSDLVEWANLIEGREDIDYENKYRDIIVNIIYQIANPDINDKITISLIKELKESL